MGSEDMGRQPEELRVEPRRVHLRAKLDGDVVVRIGATLCIRAPGRVAGSRPLVEHSFGSRGSPPESA